MCDPRKPAVGNFDMTPFRSQASVVLVSAALLLCLAGLACRATADERHEVHAGDGPAAEITSSSSSSGGGGVEQRKEPKLFRLLDFDRFKRIFKKTYSSWREELNRKRLYLARAWRSFKSVLKYKSGDESSYKSLNKMSDWTPEERKRLLNKAGPGSKQQVAVERSKEEELENKARQVERAAEEEASDIRDAEDVKRKMIEAANLASGDNDEREDASLKEISETNSGGTSRRSKRETVQLEASKSLLSVAELMGGDALLDQDEGDKPKPMVAPSIEGNVQYGKFDVNKLQGLSFGAGNLPSKEKGKKKRKLPHAKETIYEIDHRPCLNEPRSQDDCGSCFAFSAMAVLEWHYCKKNKGEKVSFAPQMILDCANKASCSGGYVSDVLKFVKAVGLEPESKWPYAQFRGACPFRRPIEDEPLAKSKAAFWKVENFEIKDHPHESWEEELRNGPIAINLAVGDAFPDYGGGVDELEDCVPEQDLHAIALVGRGREDGKDFWLLRNSYDTDWGENGHYKVSFEAMARCVWRGVDEGLAVGDSRSLKFVVNPDYAAEKIDKFIQKRLKQKADRLEKEAAAAAARAANKS